MNRPTIRHPDLSPCNIFVSDRGEITSMIDWHQCVVLPLFLESGIPRQFHSYGDEDFDNNRPPDLPDKFDSLSDEEKPTQEEIFRRRQLHFFYCAATSKINRRHYNAMLFDPYSYRKGPYACTISPWKGDSVSLRAYLLRIIPQWAYICS